MANFPMGQGLSLHLTALKGRYFASSPRKWEQVLLYYPDRHFPPEEETTHFNCRAAAARPTGCSRPQKAEIDGQDTKFVLRRSFSFTPLNKSMIHRYTWRETSYLVVWWEVFWFCFFPPVLTSIQPMPFLPQTSQISTSKPRCKCPMLLIVATLMYTDLLHNIHLNKTVGRKKHQEASLLFRFMTVPLWVKFWETSRTSKTLNCHRAHCVSPWGSSTREPATKTKCTDNTKQKLSHYRSRRNTVYL